MLNVKCYIDLLMMPAVVFAGGLAVAESVSTKYASGTVGRCHNGGMVKSCKWELLTLLLNIVALTEL